MDPFIECQEWSDFHSRFNLALSEILAPRIEPSYIVRVELRVYVERPLEEDRPTRVANVAVVEASGSGAGGVGTGTLAAAATATECEIPMPEERRETYLVIREVGTREVVTVIETLSPANKRAGGDGRREYLRKRADVLGSDSHLVELDLLRGGLRLPMVTPLPPGDYYAIISRSYRRPKAEVYAWTVRHRLPTIPIPLRRGEPDVPLNLQEAFATVYERARYHLSLDYTRPLEPPLAKAEAQWARKVLEQLA